MTENQALNEALEYIKFPVKSGDNSKWIVEYKKDDKWQIILFNLQEDALSFYYSKLNEKKLKILDKTKLRIKQ